MKRPILQFGLTALSFALGASAVGAQSLEGRWQASLNNNGTGIPFRLDITGQGPALKGTLYNGDDKEFTTKASFEKGTLILNLEHYLTRIVANVKDGELVGKIEMRGDKGPEGSAFHAKRYVASTAKVDAPSIAGQWIIPVDSPKGEKAWRFIAKQNGAEATAAILRVDGDTGALTGSYQNGKFVLSHFDGSRPYLLEVTPAADGTLNLEQKGGGPRTGKETVMAHPYHHSLSSVRKWGGIVEDYQCIHDWFDESKQITADFRHRALRHHAEGIFMAETIFGSTITLSTGRVIPVRWIGEQHVREDLGFIPSFADWVKSIRPEPWMGRAQKLDETQTTLA